MKKSEGKSHEASVEQCSRNNNLENTHLVLQETRGRKDNAAVQWGVPAVTAEWLFECDRIIPRNCCLKDPVGKHVCR